MWYRIAKVREVALVIYVRNHEEDLEDCLRSVLVAANNEAEVIAVNDGSTDRSREILEKFSTSIQILEGEGKGPGHARNMVFQKTHKEWFAFTEGNCVVDSHWLAHLCEALDGQANSLVSAGGIERISRKAGVTERKIGEFLELFSLSHHSSEPKFVRHNPTSNVLYAKEGLEVAGGFDETLSPLEGLDLDLRLARQGFRALFQPRAIVEHRRPQSLGALGCEMNRYGYGYARLLRKRGLCVRIQWLAIVFPLWVFAFYEIYRNYGIGITSISLLSFFAGTTFLMCIRTFSIWKGIQFNSYLIWAYVMWLLGFYSGLFKQRKLA